ncbi:alpha-amylase-like [Haliotis rufescens]|uniref:alpha-amylase-like n=1 Tax=Haliotis rufescens TaxID=6454 RepID=UPI00201EC1A0|nr:alpha-amylase-like [Haliotis rufescens]
MTKLVVCSVLVVCLALSASAANYQRTVIAIARPTEYVEYIFLQGGDRIGSPIPILHNMTVGNARSVYAQTAANDNFLNWGGSEPGQGSYTNNGRLTQAEGTPMIWTTNDRSNSASVEGDGHGFTELNYQGEHLWLADLYMDCDKTSNGWFDFKAYMVDFRSGKADPGWESHFINQEFCIVDGSMWGTQSNHQWNALNHHGRCGSFNFVMWSQNLCFANKLDDHMRPYRDEWVEDLSREPTAE